MKEEVFIMAILALFFILIIIWNVKDRAYKKGYKQAEFDVTASMFDKATWFGACSKITYNTLYLFAANYRKYGHVSADRFREDILKLDHSKRVTELSKKELERLI